MNNGAIIFVLKILKILREDKIIVYFRKISYNKRCSTCDELREREKEREE